MLSSTCWRDPFTFTWKAVETPWRWPFLTSPVLSTQSSQSGVGGGGWGAAWLTSYLTDRPQFVRLRDCVSNVVICSTGDPPGYSLFTFILHPLPCTSRTVATSKSSPTTLPLWGVCQRGTTVTTGKPSWTLSTGVSWITFTLRSATQSRWWSISAGDPNPTLHRWTSGIQHREWGWTSTWVFT